MSWSRISLRRVGHCLALCAGALVPILAHSPSAFAQAQPATPPEPPPRVEASAQFTFLDTRGNAPSQSLGAGGDWTWRPDPWMYKAKAAFAQSESDEELKARSVLALFRATRALNDRLAVYSQYDFLRNIFAGVEQRHVVEGGISYLAVDAAPHRLRADVGIGYLNEQRPDDSLELATLSAGGAYRLTISPTSEFTYEPRFLLPFTEIGAWKFDQDVSLAVAINTFLSLKVSHTLRYSNDPPQGFETTDTIMAVSLVAKLRRQ